MSAIYLASRFSRRHECHALAKLLQMRGHTITSRWVKPGDDHVIPTGTSDQAADSERRRFAMEDVDDVLACDWMISLMEEPRSNSRGGRHIEFGIALGLGKRLSIIGPRETVFHHLDHIEQFDTVEAFLKSEGIQ
jgi:nucleoside 2-deoxyribosyltransferase